jgi:hypothetical protein
VSIGIADGEYRDRVTGHRSRRTVVFVYEVTMNREIKFRGWNKVGKRMVDLKALTEFAKDATLSVDGLFLPFSEDIELMQFTGLKDKNGGEIYEGDIVHCDSPTRVCDLQVKFGCYGFGGHSHHGFFLEILNSAHEWALRKIDIDRGDYEVIGNIYENPELIEDGES